MNGEAHDFCCFLCDFFWRRERLTEADGEQAGAAFSEAR